MDLISELARRDRQRHKAAVTAAREAEREYWRLCGKAGRGEDFSEEEIDLAESVIASVGKDLSAFENDVAVVAKYLQLEAESKEADAKISEVNRLMEAARSKLLSKVTWLREQGVETPLRSHPGGFYQTDAPALRPYLQEFDKHRLELDRLMAVSRAHHEAELKLRAAMGEDVSSPYGDPLEKWRRMGEFKKQVAFANPTRPGARKLLLGDGRTAQIKSNRNASSTRPIQ